MLARPHAIVLIALCCFGIARDVHAEIRQFRALDSGQKLLPSHSFHSKPTHKVNLFGMRNETVSFQVVVEADDRGASEVALVLPRVGKIQDSNIEIFREDSVLVRERSHDLFWKPGSRAEPEGIIGQVPDRLVPLLAAVDLGANQRQVFWVDIWIPPDADGGFHKGELIITDKGGCSEGCKLSIEVEVLALSMPDTPHTKTMLWFSGGEPDAKYVHRRYLKDPDLVSEADKRALRLRHYHLSRKHRVTLFWEYHELPSEELDSLLSGEAYTEEEGYVGPGQGLGQDVLVIRSYDGVVDSIVAAKWQEYIAAFPDLLDTFVYTMDEPPKSKFAQVNARARASRPLQAFVTTAYDSSLDIDIFAAASGVYTRKNAQQATDAGKKMWIYNGRRPFSGSFGIDDVAISPRVNPWIQYKEGIERWFYWESTYYLDFQGKRGAVNVGAEAANFSNRHGDLLNGDGLLMYPGRDLLYPETDLGLDGPVASIRLKNWRRGIEDVEYLVMARAAGHGREVDALLQALLPQSLDEASESSAVSWPEEGAHWRLARRYLFELLRDGNTSVRLEDIARPSRHAVPTSTIRYYLVGLGAFLLLVIALIQRNRRVKGESQREA